MNILVSKTHVDLEAPIQMTEEQLEKFTDFFEKLFSDVEIDEVMEPDREPPGPGERIPWTADHYLALLKTENNEEIARGIGRSDMSIRMQRGYFVPEFLSWMNKKGYSAPYTKKMINEYLKEKGYK